MANHCRKAVDASDEQGDDEHGRGVATMPEHNGRMTGPRGFVRQIERFVEELATKTAADESSQ